MSESAIVQVAAAAVFDSQGRVLIARRPEQTHQGGLWEFPGGKLDPHETPQECLKRELKEELSIEAEIRNLIHTSKFNYGHMEVELLLYTASYRSGEFVLQDHEEIAWFLPKDLPKYDFVEADKPIVKRLTKGL